MRNKDKILVVFIWFVYNAFKNYNKKNVHIVKINLKNNKKIKQLT